MAYPIPRVEPVTSAILPVKSIFMSDVSVEVERKMECWNQRGFKVIGLSGTGQCRRQEATEAPRFSA
jgi:hypothetical protein